MKEGNSEELRFKVNCSNLKYLIDLEDIKNLTKMVVAPEKYREELDLDKDEVTVFSEMLEASRETGNYEIGHENDDYHLGNPGPITSLLETESSLKCRGNNDPIHLAAILMHRITEGHSFEEGNKRTAFLAASVFIVRWQLTKNSEGPAAIPKLEEDLLEALRSIANNENTKAEDLEHIFGDKLRSRIKEINSSQ